MGRYIERFIPTPFQESARKLVHILIRIRNFGFRHFCPLCQSRFRSFQPLIKDQYSRLNARQCPICRSMERHRLVWLVLSSQTDMFDGRAKKMLHIAPEKILEEKFRQTDGLDYLSGDLDSSRAMEQMDITDIPYPDETFHVIYCSHVLEHVPEDVKAMREFYRVLKTGCWALIVVPVMAETTFEDPQVTTPEERKRVFGHPEHVRICGKDYKKRLEDAGFAVHTTFASDSQNRTQMTRLGLDDYPIFLCRKI